MKILVVDDSAMSRLMLRNAVQALGHQCLVAEDGTRAWELFCREAAEVVVSDWVMPGLDGPELCRRIRGSAGPYAYFVLLTVLEDRQCALEGMQAGADDYLVKPLDAGELRIRLVNAARITSLHRELASRQAELERAVARREALVRATRRIAAASDSEQLLSDVLAEAVSMLGADDGGVARWEAAAGTLRRVRSFLSTALGGVPVPLETSASGQAVLRREAVVVNDYARQVGPSSPCGRQAVQAAVAVPLLHEGKLLGSLVVNTFQPDRRFSEDDARTLELLAGTAAAALVSLERARLAGVLLAARTAQHELNNKLAIATGYAEILALSATLPDELRENAQEVLGASMEAASIVDRLRRVTSLHETDWGKGLEPTIDLKASVG